MALRQVCLTLRSRTMIARLLSLVRPRHRTAPSHPPREHDRALIRKRFTTQLCTLCLPAPWIGIAAAWPWDTNANANPDCPNPDPDPNPNPNQVGLAAAWPWDKKPEPVEEDMEGNLLIPLALGAAIVVVLVVACSTKPREGRQQCRKEGLFGRQALMRPKLRVGRGWPEPQGQA